VRRQVFRTLIVVLLLAAPGVIGVAASAAPSTGFVSVRPNDGPAGTAITIHGRGYRPNCGSILVSFTDAAGVKTSLGTTPPSAHGTFRMASGIPLSAATGAGRIDANQVPVACLVLGHTTFTVTGGG
jgi:hypothetical protein